MEPWNKFEQSLTPARRLEKRQPTDRRAGTGTDFPRNRRSFRLFQSGLRLDRGAQSEANAVHLKELVITKEPRAEYTGPSDDAPKQARHVVVRMAHQINTMEERSVLAGGEMSVRQKPSSH